MSIGIVTSMRVFIILRLFASTNWLQKDWHNNTLLEDGSLARRFNVRPMASMEIIAVALIEISYYIQSIARLLLVLFKFYNNICRLYFIILCVTC